MADFQYNSVYVDETYSPIVIANLRTDTFLVSGLTYNSQYEQGDLRAGVVKFHKFTRAIVEAGAPAQDFSSAEPVNTLTPVYLTNAFRSSKKLYQVTANSVGIEYADQVLAGETENIREGRERCALAALAHKSKTSSNTDTLTSTTIRDQIIADKTVIQKLNAKPAVIVMSPDAFSALLSSQVGAAGPFTPVTNDELVRAGITQQYMGMYVAVSSHLGNAANTAVKYNDDDPTDPEKINLSLTDYIIYDAKYFAVIDNLVYANIIDSQTFAGSLCNIEMNSGIKMLEQNAAIKHAHLAVESA